MMAQWLNKSEYNKKYCFFFPKQSFRAVHIDIYIVYYHPTLFESDMFNKGGKRKNVFIIIIMTPEKIKRHIYV